MALPRPLIRLLREGRYQPSPIGKRARAKATELRQRPIGTPSPPAGGTAEAIKARLITKKQVIDGDTIKFNPRRSIRAVRESDAIQEMVVALDFTNQEMATYASLASVAWARFDATGDAGELSQYLAYDFLWYH